MLVVCEMKTLWNEDFEDNLLLMNQKQYSIEYSAISIKPNSDSVTWQDIQPETGTYSTLSQQTHSLFVIDILYTVHSNMGFVWHLHLFCVFCYVMFVC